MIALALILSLAAVPEAWLVRTQTNLLGQPEAIAETRESESAPGRYLKFSCSVMSGPVFEAGLGVKSFEDFTRFDAGEAAAAQSAALTIQPGGGAPVTLAASRAPAQVTAHAFTVTGSDAVVAAHAIAQAQSATVSAAGFKAEFEVSTSGPAIEQVLAACPFMG